MAEWEQGSAVRRGHNFADVRVEGGKNHFGDTYYIGQESHQETYKKCHRVFRTSDYERHKERNPDRVENTHRWFLNHKQYTDWRDSRGSRLLWVTADPGCGKSVLAKSLIDNELRPSLSRRTCYFFFKDDIEEQKSITNALCAILHQLFRQKPELLELAKREYDANGDNLKSNFYLLWNILTTAATSSGAGEIICILDALDECEISERSILLESLRSLYLPLMSQQPSSGGLQESRDHGHMTLKFLVTSRHYFDIDRGFGELTCDPFATIHLAGEEETQSIKQEIETVIRARVQEMGRKFKFNDSERSSLETELLNMTHWTYLFVDIIFKVIEQQLTITAKRLKKIVGSIPTSLEEAYETILQRSTDPIQAKTLLHIVVAATRPLTLQEMNVALAIDDRVESYEDLELDLEPDDRFRITVRNLCGLFVTVVDSRIYLIHQTAHEFLVKNKDESEPNSYTADLMRGHPHEGTPSNLIPGVTRPNSQDTALKWRHSLEPRVSNRTLAERCLLYILLNSVETHDRTLLHYATNSWHIHFSKSAIRSDETTAALAQNICGILSKPNDTLFSMPAGHHVLLSDTLFRTSSNVLTIASVLGLDAVVKRLLEASKVDVDSCDALNRTPLIHAASYGHEGVVKLLLGTGKVNVDLSDERGQTSLSYAVMGGYEGVVKLLLESGKADVNLRDTIGLTPLHYAAIDGHEAVVKVLLECSKANANSGNRYGFTPLHYAAREGYDAMVKMLLETGKADGNSRDMFGFTPLHIAAQYGKEAVVKLLLASGKADANLTTNYGETSLSLAHERGHETVVELLRSSTAIASPN